MLRTTNLHTSVKTKRSMFLWWVLVFILSAPRRNSAQNSNKNQCLENLVKDWSGSWLNFNVGRNGRCGWLPKVWLLTDHYLMIAPWLLLLASAKVSTYTNIHFWHYSLCFWWDSLYIYLIKQENEEILFATRALCFCLPVPTVPSIATLSLTISTGLWLHLLTLVRGADCTPDCAHRLWMESVCSSASLSDIPHAGGKHTQRVRGRSLVRTRNKKKESTWHYCEAQP